MLIESWQSPVMRPIATRRPTLTRSTGSNPVLSAMKILIMKRGENEYNADFIEIPGSPATGFGETPEEAVASLFIVTEPKWIKEFKETPLEIIRDEAD